MGDGAPLLGLLSVLQARFALLQGAAQLVELTLQRTDTGWAYEALCQASEPLEHRGLIVLVSRR